MASTPIAKRGSAVDPGNRRTYACYTHTHRTRTERDLSHRSSRGRHEGAHHSARGSAGPRRHLLRLALRRSQGTPNICVCICDCVCVAVALVVVLS
jgi:hypothetical protein